ncbi:heat shock protein 70 family [Dipodascopsis uninucleata]
MTSEEGVTIGISFGNTNSSIAFPTKDGKVEVIANQDGDRNIPSMLSYVGDDEFHGFQAKAQLIRNPSNTIANFRDFIGRPYSQIDPTYSHASAHPVTENDVVGYNIKSSEDSETFISVSEAVKRHLGRLKDSAADFLGKPISGAVIAVPTDFSAEQQSTLVKIAADAGLNIRQIIKEPIAALLAADAAAAASNDGSFPGDRIVVVADFGHTRTDGAVVAVRGGMYTTLATAHNYELGGASLDQVLVDHFAKEFEKKYSIDPRTSSARSLAKLTAEAEVTKKTLSNVTSATISIESLAGGYDFHSTINRLRYELLARKVLDQAAIFIEELVKKAGLDVLLVDQVILAGGSAYMPKIASRIASVFGEETQVIATTTAAKAVEPTELVARGTAIQASLIESYEQSDIEESLKPAVVNALHLSKPIGVVLADGSFKTILDNFTAVPFRRSVTFDGPTEGGDALIELWEGSHEIVTQKVEKTSNADDEDDEEFDDEDDDEELDDEERLRVAKPSKKLADISLKGLKPKSKVEVIVNLAADGKLDVAVREVGSQAIRKQIAL